MSCFRMLQKKKNLREIEFLWILFQSTKANEFQCLYPKINFAESLMMYFREQKLANLMHNKKYLKAIGLAITLDQPFKVLNIIKGW